MKTCRLFMLCAREPRGAYSADKWILKGGQVWITVQCRWVGCWNPLKPWPPLSLKVSTNEKNSLLVPTWSPQWISRSASKLNVSRLKMMRHLCLDKCVHMSLTLQNISPILYRNLWWLMYLGFFQTHRRYGGWQGQTRYNGPKHFHEEKHSAAWEMMHEFKNAYIKI